LEQPRYFYPFINSGYTVKDTNKAGNDSKDQAKHDSSPI